MFRIDRNYVNLAATRFVQVGNGEDTEADAVGESLYAAASATYVTQAQQQAQEILADAKEDAERIRQEARDEVAILMVSARDQAEEDRRRMVQEGFADGAKEGKRSFDEQLAKRLREDDEVLQRVISEVYSERERTYDALEDEVTALAVEIVRKIINPPDEALGDVFRPLIRNALKQITPTEKVVLRVSQAEYERFFSSGSAVFQLESGSTVTAAIIRDPSLDPGDCIIDAEDETINAGVESQLKYVKLAFERSKTDNGKPNGENGMAKAENGKWNAENGKANGGNGKLKAGNGKSDGGNGKPKAGNGKSNGENGKLT